jgi:mono/diheme cytochrome c family protein
VNSVLFSSLLLLSFIASAKISEEVQSAEVSAKAANTETHAELHSAEKLYQQHCQSCHGVDRLGGMGPALFPENLSRLRKNKAIDVIQKGRAAT